MDAHAQAGNGRTAGGHAGDPSATSDARQREGGRDGANWEEEERAFAVVMISAGEMWGMCVCVSMVCSIIIGRK